MISPPTFEYLICAHEIAAGVKFGLYAFFRSGNINKHVRCSPKNRDRLVHVRAFGTTCSKKFAGNDNSQLFLTFRCNPDTHVFSRFRMDYEMFVVPDLLGYYDGMLVSII